MAAKFMQSAVKHPGALRDTAKRMGLIKGEEKLGAGQLATLSARARKTGNTTLLRRVNLAKTFAKYRPGSKKTSVMGK